MGTDTVFGTMLSRRFLSRNLRKATLPFYQGGGLLDDVLCVTPLAFWSPSDSSGFDDCFDFESTVGEDDLGFLQS